MTKYPYSADELNIVGEYPSSGFARMRPRFNTPISSRENMHAFAAGHPCWMPNGDRLNFNPGCVPDNKSRHFIFEAAPNDNPGGPDMFGVNWVFEPSVGGSMVVPGNPILEDANDWREVIKMPDVDSWDWEAVAERNKEYLNYDAPIWTTQFSGLFERLISFMDFEGAAMALIDEEQQDAVKELFDAVTDVYISIIEHIEKFVKLDGYTLHDDWGSQRAPFFSKDTWYEMIAPYVKKMVDYCHAHDIVFEMHSCGCLESMTDAITSIGIDMWRPQPMNDIDKMYREYGDKIRFGMNIGGFAMGVKPATPPSDEELAAVATGILERFNIPGRYVYCGSFSTEPFGKALYEGSRKMYLEW